MKMRVCVFLVLAAVILCVAPACALTDEENEVLRQTFAEYPDDGLFKLRELIDLEIERRGLQSGNNVQQKEVTVPVGVYIVGEDIPAGAYTVTFDGVFLASVSVKSSAGKSILFESLSSGERIGKLALTEGQIVQVDYDPVVFAPYDGLGF